MCCKDLWCLETACPGEPEKVQLLKAGIGNLEILWNPVPSGRCVSMNSGQVIASYVLQLIPTFCKFNVSKRRQSNRRHFRQRLLHRRHRSIRHYNLSLRHSSPLKAHNQVRQIFHRVERSVNTVFCFSVLASLIPMFTNGNSHRTTHAPLIVSFKKRNNSSNKHRRVQSQPWQIQVNERFCHRQSSLDSCEFDLRFLARMSSSPTPMTPSIGTVNAHTLQLASQVSLELSR